jgi:hypothetical protein
MEGCLLRRMSSEEDHSATRGNCKTDLTLTGLLMDGLGSRHGVSPQFLSQACEKRRVVSFGLGPFVYFLRDVGSLPIKALHVYPI